MRLVVILDSIGANDTSHDHGQNKQEANDDHPKGDVLHDAPAVAGQDRLGTTIWFGIEPNTITGASRDDC